MKDHVQGNKFLLNQASDDALAYPVMYLFSFLLPLFRFRTS
jgi:hypothetical protein